MKFPQKFIDEEITEQDVLCDNSNSYQPGFMQIHLICHYRGSFKEMDSLKDKGSFLHEYIHYLQNLTTPWGLYTSMVEYQFIVEHFKYIQEHTDIVLPLQIKLNEQIKSRIDIISVGNGENPLKQNYGNRKIDRNTKILWHRKLKNINGKNYPYIILDIKCEDDVKSVNMGAYIIKESMAALYQMQLDPSATHPEYDLPYNVVKILAEQHFPNIANDDKKLISICYLSLFSLSPGEVLIEQLDFANQNTDLTGIQLIERFIEENKIRINDEGHINVFDFYDKISTRFEEILKVSLQIKELDYIHEALQRAKLSKGIIPIISPLYEKGINEEIIQELIDMMGIPYIYTDYNEYHYPQSTKNERESPDMIALIGQHALFSFLVRPNIYRCCPLKYMCKDSPFDKDECFDYPWNGTKCPMTIMGDTLSMKNKNVSWS